MALDTSETAVRFPLFLSVSRVKTNHSVDEGRGRLNQTTFKVLTQMTAGFHLAGERHHELQP